MDNLCGIAISPLDADSFPAYDLFRLAQLIASIFLAHGIGAAQEGSRSTVSQSYQIPMKSNARLSSSQAALRTLRKNSYLPMEDARPPHRALRIAYLDGGRMKGFCRRVRVGRTEQGLELSFENVGRRAHHRDRHYSVRIAFLQSGDLP